MSNSALAQINTLRDARGPAQPSPQLLADQAPATAPVGIPKSQELTAATIDQRRKLAEESAEVDDETKVKIAELYRVAAEQLRLADERINQLAVFRARAENVQQRLKDARAKLEQDKQRLDEVSRGGLTDFVPLPLPPQDIEQGTGDNTPEELDRLKRELARLVHERTQFQQEDAKRKLRLQELKDAQIKVEAERAARPTRKQEVRALELSIPERLDSMKEQLAAAPPAEEPSLLTQAKRTELEARLIAAEREVPALQAELTAYEAEDAANLLTLKSDLAAQRVTVAAKEVALLESRLKEIRDAAEELAVRVTEAEAVHAQPLLRALAERSAEITKEARSITPLIDQAGADRKQARQDFDELQRRLEQTRNKVEKVGLTHAIGAMLRKERNELPDLRKRLSDVRGRQDTIDEAQLAFYDYEEELAALTGSQTQRVEEILKAAPSDLTDEERDKLVYAAEDVIDRQKHHLGMIRGNYNTYFDTLVDLSTTEQLIIKLSRQFATYIDERVLWIRSSKPLTSNIRLDDSDAWILNASRWSGAGSKLWLDMRHNAVTYLSAFVFLMAMLHLGSRFRREIREIGEQAARGSFNRFAPTTRAAVLTVIISIPWPCLLLFLAWRLTSGTNGEVFARALGHGCYAAAIAYLPLEIFRQLCRARGVAQAHFEWPASALSVLRRDLKFLLLMGLPLTFVTATLYASDSSHGIDFLERCGFIWATIVLAVFLRRILRPRGGVFQEYIAYHTGGWVDRLQHVWYSLGVLSPLVLAGLAFTGYYYTATELSWRLFITVWLLVSLVVVRGLLLRLLLIHRRRMSMEQLRERRELAKASESAAGALGPGHSQNVLPTEELEDLRTQTEQSRRLMTAVLAGVGLIGVWLAWVDVLPALSLLDQWSLWETTVQVRELVESPSGGEPQTITRDVVDYVTIADLALGVLIGIMTFIGARNIPGVTEMTVLQRLPLDNSVRYAITALVSYAIAFVGIMVACRAIGLRWQQVQWLATALTFGLAFGLQEMFANFVAGVILLFERPIRVGDVVTVSDVTGLVSRIRMRATTIMDWDRKEFIVPNKEFITGRLLNWTLSDKVNRIVINVGIAYGSDTERAREILLKVANDHELVLDDPKTMVTFEGFGDNSLNFCLRTYLPSLENRLNVVHELHTAIDQSFRKAGIEIAFPQRDLHIRMVPDSLGRSIHDNHAENGSGRRPDGATQECRKSSKELSSNLRA